MNLPYFFGIRHLSPAAAFHVRTLLDKLNRYHILKDIGVIQSILPMKR